MENSSFKIESQTNLQSATVVQGTNDARGTTNTTIELAINKFVVTAINKVCSLGSEYIDLVAEGTQCIISVNWKGIIYAAKLKLNKPVVKVNIRLPIQIFRQVNINFAIMRILNMDNEFQVFLFTEDLNIKPIKMAVKRNLSYLDYFNVVEAVFKDAEFGKNSLFTKCVPALSYVAGKTTGMPVKDFMIGNGIIFIDSQLVKFYVNTYVEDLNVVIPSGILKHLSKDTQAFSGGYEMRDGYNILKSGNFMYAWKAVRPMAVNEYKTLESLKPSFTCLCSIKNATTFIRNLKIADNREQVCTLDFKNSVVVVSESDILRHEIPVQVRVLDGKPVPVNLGLRQFLEVTKDVDNGILEFRVYGKFIEIFIKTLVENFGEVDMRFILKCMSN